MAKAIAAVIFDLMDTLLYDPFREATKAATGLPLREAFSRRDPEAWPLFEIEAIDEATFAARYFAPSDPPLRFDLDAFHRARRDGYRWLDGMEALVDALVGRVDLVIASNYPRWIDEVAATFALTRRFGHIVASCDLRVRKPSEAFFSALLARTGHAADACLFVDDRADNCAAAAKLGMRTHRFQGVAELRETPVEASVLER